ncbi:MAG: transferase [Bacteroidetes bacterium]|nr:transferase [Bacteroidota bacterium]
MAICLFEDLSISTLLPLTHLHPDFDLRCGIFTGRERVLQYFAGEKLLLSTRMGLVDVMSERTGLPVNTSDGADLYISGTALMRPALAHAIREHRGEDRLYTSGGILLAATVVSQALREKIHHWLKTGMLREELSSSSHSRPDLKEFAAPILEVESEALCFPWELIDRNASMIEADADFFMLGTIDPMGHMAASAELIRAERIFVGPDARIGAGSILDATEGPIIIDAGAVVMPQALVMGPAYIGPHTSIKAGAKIYRNTSIGPWCKVGGEVEDTIFHSFANKQHDGFVGHSYFAPWTNLGADSNTSDLKNNYSSIRVTLEAREHDTGRMFLGTIMADHSKCGINTMFNTGTVAGVGCNIHGGDFPPKFLPSFSWGGADGLQEYDFERFCATASIVMQRRGKHLTENERRLLRDVFVETSGQRRFAS